jgi:hypothetical protein
MLIKWWQAKNFDPATRFIQAATTVQYSKNVICVLLALVYERTWTAHTNPENEIFIQNNVLHLLTMVDRSLQNLCEGIRSNDPSITKVMLLLNSTKWPQLLKGLQRNTKVTSLHLHGGGPINGALDFSSLLEYLKQSKSIREVDLSIGSPRLVRLVLQSLTENLNANLVTFESTDSLPCMALVALIQAKSHHLKHLSIKQMDVSPSGDEALSDERCRQLSVAIASLPTLESLALEYESLDYISLEILSGRMNSLACLRKLRIGRMYWLKNHAVIAALRLLGSGVRLEALELKYFEFDQEMIEYLVHGLASCKTLTHLTLENCTFPGDSAAASKIVRFLQSSRDTCSHDLSNGYAESPDENTSSSLSVLSSEGGKIARAIGCFGSSLLVVHLVLRNVANVHQDVDVIRSLASEGSQVLWLTVGRITDAAIKLLTRDLPAFLRLHKLTFQSVPYLVKTGNEVLPWPAAFLQVLRKNGSLREVSAASKPPGPAHMRLIQAWCDRNRVAPRLLTKLNLDTEAFDYAHVQTPMHLSPSVYKVGSQTPRMVPTWFLTGMLASGEAIGFRSNSKKRSVRN